MIGRTVIVFLEIWQNTRANYLIEQKMFVLSNFSLSTIFSVCFLLNGIESKRKYFKLLPERNITSNDNCKPKKLEEKEKEYKQELIKISKNISLTPIEILEMV